MAYCASVSRSDLHRITRGPDAARNETQGAVEDPSPLVLHPNKVAMVGIPPFSGLQNAQLRPAYRWGSWIPAERSDNRLAVGTERCAQEQKERNNKAFRF